MRERPKSGITCLKIRLSINLSATHKHFKILSSPKKVFGPILKDFFSGYIGYCLIHIEYVYWLLFDTY